MNDMQAVEFESVLDADLNRAMREAQARSQAEKDLPTLTKAELAELLFEQVGLNKREAKDMVETFSMKCVMRWNAARRLNSLVSATFNCATSRKDLAAILKPVKKFLFLRVV